MKKRVARQTIVLKNYGLLRMIENPIQAANDSLFAAQIGVRVIEIHLARPVHELVDAVPDLPTFLFISRAGRARAIPNDE
jgi:hypothetical protein